MNRGVPPTARNARTGEFTPPGMTARARSKRAAEAGASLMAPVCRARLADMSEPREWYVLLHTPGPAIEPEQNVFEHPDIGEHYAFLQRRGAAGEARAAGPLRGGRRARGTRPPGPPPAGGAPPPTPGAPPGAGGAVCRPGGPRGGGG